MKNLKNKTKQTIKDILAQDNEQNANINYSYANTTETNFFYTNDKHINGLDNEQILYEIQKQYPELINSNSDKIIKKNIVFFLENELFIEKLLKFYNMSVFDLFKLLYAYFSSIFRGTYLLKIKRIIANKNYANVISKHKTK